MTQMHAEEAVAVDDPSRPLVPDRIAKVLTDPSAHADGRLHDALTWLRANEPLGIAETEDFDPFWVLTKHADIRAVATRPDIFHSGDSSITLMSRDGQAQVREMLQGQNYPIRSIVNMDMPDHPVYRAMTAAMFHARSLDQMADAIRGVAREFIDRLAATGGECDFARTVAFVYPLRVLMTLLGVPAEDELHLLRLTQEMLGTHDPDQARDGVALEGAAAADQMMAITNEFFDYFDTVMADRRANPRDDVATAIALAEVNGQPIPRMEALSYFVVLATAGHDTTAAVTAGAMIELARNPEEFRKVKANPSLVNSLVEEATRWISPSKITMRTAAEDFALQGRHIRRGELVALAWASANRDEDVFEDPFVFRADRRPNKLLAYGNGPHVCLGQHLARLEMRILYEELLKRLEHVELTGEPTTASSFQISGPKKVPLRFVMN